MVTDRTIDVAHLLLPHLVLCAKMKKTITYKELADKIGVHYKTIFHSLGYIRDEICDKQKFPLINVLVVRKDDDLPGDGFLSGGTKSFSDSKFKNEFEKNKTDVFSCTKWDDLLRNLGLKSIK